MKVHLTQYKRDVLGVEEDGVWVMKNETRPHLLPISEMWLNILPLIRDDFREYFACADPKLKLHRDFHHLNSSQAMGFNLFFPIIRSEEWDRLLKAILCSNEQVLGHKFEHVPDPIEFTNLDFWMKRADSSEVHIEVKLTETAFGRVSPTSEVHLEKLKNTYRNRLDGKIGSDASDAVLLEHYQLMRIVSGLNLSRSDEAVVIAPAANVSIRRQFNLFQDRLLPSIASRVRLVALESVVAALTESEIVKQAEFAGSYEEFKTKYLIPQT